MKRGYLPAVVAALAVLASACSESTDAASSDSDIVGGIDATGRALDAVGSIRMEANGSGAGCTGTLISPRLVLTAKHCVLADKPARKTYLEQGGSMSFGIGPDSRRPTRTVAVSEVLQCGLDQGGAARLGCDVAILRLAEPILDITPIPPSPTPLTAEMIGETFTAIGYGTIDAANLVSGPRKMATMSLRAIEGQSLHALFPTYDDFTARIAKAEGDAYVQQQAALLHYYYDVPLLAGGYEAWVGGGADEAQVCHGDSGGPLLKVVDGKFRVFGVVSTGVQGVKSVCESAGGNYATFGPEARDLIARAEMPSGGLRDPLIEAP